MSGMSENACGKVGCLRTVWTWRQEDAQISDESWVVFYNLKAIFNSQGWASSDLFFAQTEKKSGFEYQRSTKQAEDIFPGVFLDHWG